MLAIDARDQPDDPCQARCRWRRGRKKREEKVADEGFKALSVGFVFARVASDQDMKCVELMMDDAGI